MKYSISYNADIKLRKEADEIRVPFNKLGYIYDFMKEYPNKKYVINIDTISSNFNKQLAFVKAVVGDNYTINCPQIGLLKIVKEQGYNCFYKYAAADWETFNNLMEIGVSDILIDGPICFDMPSLKKLLNKAEKPINIRVRPTTSANALFANINNTFSVNAFYIRPEDTKYYENAIHTFVFDTEEYIEKEEVIFKIYKNQVYTGKIVEIMPQLNQNILNHSITLNIGERRNSCKQNCKMGDRCDYCFAAFDIAKKLSDVFNF